MQELPGFWFLPISSFAFKLFENQFFRQKEKGNRSIISDPLVDNKSLDKNHDINLEQKLNLNKVSNSSNNKCTINSPKSFYSNPPETVEMMNNDILRKKDFVSNEIIYSPGSVNKFSHYKIKNIFNFLTKTGKIFPDIIGMCLLIFLISMLMTYNCCDSAFWLNLYFTFL